MAEPLFNVTNLNPDPEPVFSTQPEAPTVVPYSDNQLKVTSSLAALAQQRNALPTSRYQTIYEMTQEASQKIQSGQEPQLRQDISDAKKDADVTATHADQNDILTSPEVSDKPEQLKASIEQEDAIKSQPSDPHTLEKEGIAQIRANGNQDQTQAIINKQRVHIFGQEADDHLVVGAAWNRAIDQAAQAVHDESWPEFISDFFAFPAQNWWAAGHASKGAVGFTPGQTLQNAVNAFGKMSTNEQLEAIPQIVDLVQRNSGLFKQNKQETLAVLQALRSTNYRDQMGANFWTTLDVGTTVAGLKPGAAILGAARFIRKPAQMLVAAGDRAAAVNTVVSDMMRDSLNVPEHADGVGNIHGNSLIEAAIPDQFKTANMIGPGPGIAGSVAKKFQDTQAAIDTVLKGVAKTERLNPEQLQQAIKAETDRFAERLDSNNIINVANEGWVFKEDILPEDIEKYAAKPEDDLLPVDNSSLFEVSKEEDTGLHYLSAYVGDFKGYGGTSSKELVELGIKQRGWNPDTVKAVEMPDGQWAAKVTQVVREDGVFTPEMTTAQRPWGRVAEMFKDANDMRDETFQGPALRSLGVEAKVQNQVFRQLTKPIQKIGPKGRKLLQAVVDLGNQERVPGQSQPGKWYNINEFNQHFDRIAGRPPTEKEITAYYSLKQMRDVDHYMKNRGVYVEKARRGIMTVSAKNELAGIDIARQNGREIDRNLLGTNPFMDLDTGTSWSKGSAKAQQALDEKLSSGNYRIIELEKPLERGKKKVKYVLAHKDMSGVEALEYNQLPYVGGTPIRYEGKFYTKQAQRYTEGNENYWLSPLTHAVHKTEAAARSFANKQETARLAYRDIIQGNEEIADHEATFAQSAAHSFDQFHKYVRQGQIDVEHPFEVVSEGKEPDAMAGKGGTQWYDPQAPDIEGMYETKNRMYYSPRGEPLPDETGKLAPTVDIWKMTAKGLESAIKTYAWQDYNLRFMQNWVDLAREHLQWDQLGRNRSTVNAFMHGQLNPKMNDQALARTLEMNRTLHQRLLGYQTEEQSARNILARRFASYIDGHGKVSDWVASEAMNLQDKRPLSALKALTYNVGIAMFAPSRFVRHTTTALSANFIHPTYGFHAAAMYWPIRLLGINRESALLDHIASWGKLVTGFEPNSFKMMIKELRDSGRMDMGDVTTMTDSFSGKLGGSRLGQMVSGVVRVGQSIFNEAERVNQGIGWQMAWRDALDTRPELEEGSQKFMDYVLRKSGMLANNMSRASTAGWQQTVAGVPLQFRAIESRIVEKMLPAAWGGNSMLTSAQRTRFTLGNLMMYGAAGIPGGLELYHLIKTEYEKETGQPMSDTAARTMSQGAFDSVLWGISGGKIDTDFAGRMGVGSRLDELGEGRNQSAFELLAGPAGSTVGRFGDAVLDVARVMGAAWNQKSFTGATFEMMMGDMARTLPAWTNTEKAYFIYRYSQLQNPQTGAPLVPVDKLNAFAQLIGVPIREDVKYWEFQEGLDAYNSYVSKASKPIEYATRQAWAAYEQGDAEGADHWTNLIRGFMKPYEGNQRDLININKKVREDMKMAPDQYDRLVERIYNRTGQYPEGETP